VLDFSERPAPVSGGFDTRIFTFRLKGAPPALAGPLILRLLGPQHDPARALRERTVQNTLVDLGYPAPRVYLASADVSRLGGAFLVMERLPGRPLLEARQFNLSAVLVEMQVRLHALDADVLLRALDREGPPLHRNLVSFDAYLAQLAARIDLGGLDGLGPAMRWLVAHRPAAPDRLVICHGDFHPHNLLYDGRVTGVLDWPNALVADPAYDVASTVTILALAPLELSGMPTLVRWVARVARPILVKRYLAGYRRHCPLDPRVLAYYEAASAMRALVRAGEDRRRRDAPPANLLQASAFAENLAVHVARVTGIAPTLPPARR
jgi:aminoglycoside phosphotransferase (APT) family kinase protein